MQSPEQEVVFKSSTAYYSSTGEIGNVINQKLLRSVRRWALALKKKKIPNK